ncbi:MAG: sulfite exporter TauE/SafE family protein [Methanosphaera stadtmanae]|nr:sulfite exporter TauE/SafE family protein [Methanosphaera stadtmanae]
MDFIIYVILLLLSGCFAGLMAGLLGIGGGVILTPIHYFLLLSIGVNSSLALHIAFATSLAVILVTMINSTREHKKNGFVETEHLKLMLIFGFIGAVIGSIISTHTDVYLLKIFFGFMCLFSVLNMLLIKNPENYDNISHSKNAHLILGLSAGLLCGLLGVGGGIIMIPSLTILLKYPTHKAIGTSSATIIATSLGGLITNIILGWNVSGLPPFSLGYVNLTQFVFLTITSSIVSVQAAKLSKNINPKILKASHIIIVLYMGLKMVGLI